MSTLHLKIWVKRVDGLWRIVHEHYTKPMSTKAVLDSRSAMAWGTRRTVLTQEALRIMLNCIRKLPWERTAAHLTHFSERMQYSGYEHSFRTEVIKSALHAFSMPYRCKAERRSTIVSIKDMKRKRARARTSCEKVKLVQEREYEISHVHPLHARLNTTEVLHRRS